MREYRVEEQTGRLDKVLSQLAPDFSRSQIKKLIDEQLVQVNNANVKSKYTVKTGDIITLQEPEVKSVEIKPEQMNLDIVYEDDDVIVVNKPQGMVVHPAPGHEEHTLVNGLLYHSPLSTINGEYRPGIVHRIDKDTSGLLMVAKNDKAHRSLSQQLKDKTNKREYIALVYGKLPVSHGTIDAPIGRSPKDRKKQAIVAEGRHAVTHFELIKQYDNYALVKCILETGRTHQIRVHMKYIGHPVVGDPLYGPKKAKDQSGQYLHAAILGFTHPTTGKEMVFEAPLPEKFKHFLNNLDKEQNN